MLGYVIPLCLAMLGAALLLAVALLVRGPSLPDRALALDTLYINTVALVILLGLRWQTALLFEAALIIAMLGFFGTVVLSKYVVRRDIVE